MAQFPTIAALPDLLCDFAAPCTRNKCGPARDHHQAGIGIASDDRRHDRRVDDASHPPCDPQPLVDHGRTFAGPILQANG